MDLLFHWYSDCIQRGTHCPFNFMGAGDLFRHDCGRHWRMLCWNECLVRLCFNMAGRSVGSYLRPKYRCVSNFIFLDILNTSVLLYPFPPYPVHIAQNLTKNYSSNHLLLWYENSRINYRKIFDNNKGHFDENIWLGPFLPIIP